ncbi:MAG TPA: hypothetical protein VGF69_20545 [Thermoanaerobaculia bacterium]
MSVVRFPSFVVCAVLIAGSALAQVDATRVANDAMVVDRVAEASKRDLPVDLLKRIVNEDIELLRGRSANGLYQYARYERIEGGRVSRASSVQPPDKKSETRVLEVSAPLAYRLILDSPSRRMLVTRNRPVFIERVEVEYVPQGASATKRETISIEANLNPGEVRAVDLPDIARQATVRIFARADEEQGYANLTATLIQARVVDNPESPYADAVASAKSLVKSLDNNDVGSVRSLASRIRQQLRAPGAQDGAPSTQAASQLQAQPATRTIEVTASRDDAQPPIETYTELQLIEDLLTGNADEKREGLDRLHQLLRKLRPR